MTYVPLRDRVEKLYAERLPVTAIATRLGISDRAVLVHVAELDVERRVVRSKDLIEKSGATYRQINYWTIKGYLEPVPVEGEAVSQVRVGSGSRQVYPESSVLLVQLVLELIDIGLEVEAAFCVARMTIENPGAPLAFGDWIVRRDLAP